MTWTVSEVAARLVLTMRRLQRGRSWLTLGLVLLFLGASGTAALASGKAEVVPWRSLPAVGTRSTGQLAIAPPPGLPLHVS
jgi:hypothetical protein